MKKALAILCVAMSLSPLALSGCERTVSEQVKSSTDSNGKTKTESKTVTQDSGGGVTVTEEKHTSNP
jgi:hypothetical protein